MELLQVELKLHLHRHWQLTISGGIRPSWHCPCYIWNICKGTFISLSSIAWSLLCWCWCRPPDGTHKRLPRNYIAEGWQSLVYLYIYIYIHIQKRSLQYPFSGSINMTLIVRLRPPPGPTLTRPDTRRWTRVTTPLTWCPSPPRPYTSTLTSGPAAGSVTQTRTRRSLHGERWSKFYFQFQWNKCCMAAVRLAEYPGGCQNMLFVWGNTRGNRHQRRGASRSYEGECRVARQSPLCIDNTSRMSRQTNSPPEWPDWHLAWSESPSFNWQFQFDDDLIHRRNKWHTMHDKPCPGRPKSAGPGRMESDSSTEREREHPHHHRSRPRSRARFGDNPKHRYRSSAGFHS